MSDFKVKCTKFDFRWGSAPDHAGRAHSAPPGPLAVFKGPTCKGREGKGGGKGKGRGLEWPPISYWHRAPRRVNPALVHYLQFINSTLKNTE